MQGVARGGSKKNYPPLTPCLAHGISIYPSPPFPDAIAIDINGECHDKATAMTRPPWMNGPLVNCVLFGLAAGLAVSFYCLGPGPARLGRHMVSSIMWCRTVQCSVVQMRGGERYGAGGLNPGTPSPPKLTCTASLVFSAEVRGQARIKLCGWYQCRVGARAQPFSLTNSHTPVTLHTRYLYASSPEATPSL